MKFTLLSILTLFVWISTLSANAFYISPDGNEFASGTEEDPLVSFDGTEGFRDPDNNDITIAQKVNGLVVVE